MLAAAVQSRRTFAIVDHHTYVFLGDGCMMEGISHEACSLAGTLGLGKLIAIYDDNGISIDSEKGSIQPVVHRRRAPQRFEAYGWQVIRERGRPRRRRGGRGAAKGEAREAARPTLICCKTVIAQGRADQGQHRRRARRAAGRRRKSRRRARRSAGVIRRSRFPKRVYDGWDARKRGAAAERRWNEAASPPTRQQHPAEAAEFRRRMAGELPRRFRGARRRSCSQEVERQSRDDRHAQGLAERARSAGARAAGAGRRLGRPRPART